MQILEEKSFIISDALLFYALVITETLNYSRKLYKVSLPVCSGHNLEMSRAFLCKWKWLQQCLTLWKTCVFCKICIDKTYKYNYNVRFD